MSDNQEKILAYLKEVCNSENFENSSVNCYGSPSRELQKIIFKKDDKSVEFGVEVMENKQLSITEIKLIGEDINLSFDYNELGNFFGAFDRAWSRFYMYLKETLLPKYNANVVGINKRVDEFIKSEGL